MKGLAKISFTSVLWRVPLFLLTKVQMHDTPMLIGVAKGFRICGGLRQAHSGEKSCFKVFYVK